MLDDEASFLAHLPAPPLRSMVATAHGYRVPANPTGLHRGLPSRHLTLVVELAEPLRVRNLTSAVAAHGVVGGLHTGPALIDASVPQEGLQYGLTPLAAQALLGMPAAELRGRALDLAELLGGRAERLVEQLRAASGWRERFGVLDRMLLERLAGRIAAVPPELVEAWRLIGARRGCLRVTDLAAEVGWSRRHLLNRFTAVTGLSPKEAARIARFEAARALLLRPRRPTLADVAAHCGYADQSHLAREWRALAGCSVGTWLREEFPFVHDSEALAASGSPA